MTFKGRPLTEILSSQMLQDFYHYEGNAHALRQVTKLHYLVNEHGMNLTFALLNTIIKYPVSSEQIDKECGDIKCKKMGFFHAEQDLYEAIAEGTGTYGRRHPLTFILEAADDIAYKTADIEDAFKKGCINYEQFKEELIQAAERSGADLSRIDPIAMLEHQYQNGLRRKVSNVHLYAIQNFLVRLQSNLIYCATYGFTSNYDSIMEGTYKKDIFAGTYAEWIMDALGDIAYRYAFTSRGILEMEVSAGNILDFIMDRFVPAVINYDTEVPLQMMETKMVRMISENYRQTYHLYSGSAESEEEKLYLRLLLVADFVSGMTDSYARDLYQKLNGII
ncbi:MAG: dNTP triphosphohydrolase, partial [Clostridiales bacterium]|nr:dNTP triphosphohydrolase [Candidatus Blautia equi]